MVRPKHFGYNEQTASNNAFQSKPSVNEIEELRSLAVEEFNGAIEKLAQHEIDVLVIEDIEETVLPDAVFPNNWFSTHAEGIICTYPMHAPLRRAERRNDVILHLQQRFGYSVRMDFSAYEFTDLFLEGTGSLILDHLNRIAYGCRSLRTDDAVFEEFCKLMRYDGFLFDASDGSNTPIYHTNVMMALGVHEVVIALSAIHEGKEKDRTLNRILQSEKNIVDISLNQVSQFAGNMIQLCNKSGQLLWVMSQSARDSLTAEQVDLLSRHATLVSIPIPNIERVGGGSIRCMIAEIFPTA